MRKTAVFISEYDYYEKIFSDIDKHSEILLIKNKVKISLLNRFRLRVAKSLEKRIESNKCARFLYNKYLNSFYSIYPIFLKEKIETVILLDNFTFFDDTRFHNFLKKYSKKVKIVSINYNVIKTDDSAAQMSRMFDYNFAFDDDNCLKYGFYHFTGIYSSPNKVINNQKQTLFFLGINKNRYRLLKEISIYLNKQSLKTNFTIIDNLMDNSFEDGFIIQNHRESYNNTINKLLDSNCILDIITDQQSGLSLRVVEAIIYGKRLLTNNVNILKSPYYNPNYMKYFNKVEEIDIEFLKDLSPVDYSYNKDFSPINLVKRINDLIESKEKK